MPFSHAHAHASRPLAAEAAELSRRCIEPVRYSAAIRDQNQRREGGPVPDFAPAVPPVQGAWLARLNRDEAVLGHAPAPGRTYGRPQARTYVLKGNEAESQPEARRAGGVPQSCTPVAGSQAQLLKAYRTVASLPKGLSLDVLA